MDTIEVKRLKFVLLLSSLASIALLVLAAYEEHFSGSWRDHQDRYRELAMERSTSPGLQAVAAELRPELHQIFLPELERVDRCTTCHAGIDDPRMVAVEQPLRAHSGDVLQNHPPEKFGCTVCHDGQGRHVGWPDAHGTTPHWERPLLSGAAVYTSCSRCHYEIDLYGAEQDLYARRDAQQPLRSAELARRLPGADSTAELAVSRGRRLVMDSGCLGCHKYRERGGTLGPDITYVGDKGTHGFDFTHIEAEHTVRQWLFEHFRDPARISPGTLMPDLGLDESEADALALYMSSLHRKSAPASHTPVPASTADTPADGETLYRLFCSACHGRDGRGSTVREHGVARGADAPAELMVPSLIHPDTLAVASDDYLRTVIRRGRPGTTMPAWGGRGGGGLLDEEIDRIVAYIRSLAPAAADLAQISAQRGSARAGRTLYRRFCAACHGRRGEGGIGVSLNSPTFLAVASDRFLAETILRGRPNTAMPSWSDLSSQHVSDLLAHLRSWQEPRNSPDSSIALTRRVRAGESVPGVEARIGAILYRANCVTCHGESGEGDLAPSLATQEFLSAVGDDYLCTTISRGRPGTAMPAWRHLRDEDVASLVLHLRSWQTAPDLRLPAGRIAGDWDAGRLLYGGLCASCHGESAEGGVGPQLANPVFLSTATDAMLRRWIREGKTGTPMRGFRKGGQGTAELDDAQIDNLVAFVRSLERAPAPPPAKSPSGRPELGVLWYTQSCVGCHGPEGEGASGPALANPGFLHAAGDGFLLATLALGRDGTEMRPVKRGAQSILALESDQVNDLVALLRSWEHSPPREGIQHRFVVPWDLARGERLYRSYCAGCHGVNGKGEQTEPGRLSAWAPDLNNPVFLEAATDGFLQATIVRGRTGTAMRPFGLGGQGIVELAPGDIDDIVSWIRRWSSLPGQPMTIPARLRPTPPPANPATAARRLSSGADRLAQHSPENQSVKGQ